MNLRVDEDFEDFSDANRAHDTAKHSVSMDPAARYGGRWSGMMIMKGPLTDKAIARYEKQGFYRPDAIAARADYRRKQAAKKKQWTPPNFRRADDGRLIYCPV
jgi:hypothetical protein